MSLHTDVFTLAQKLLQRKVVSRRRASRHSLLQTRSSRLAPAGMLSVIFTTTSSFLWRLPSKHRRSGRITSTQLKDDPSELRFCDVWIMCQEARHVASSLQDRNRNPNAEEKWSLQVAPSNGLGTAIAICFEQTWVAQSALVTKHRMEEGSSVRVAFDNRIQSLQDLSKCSTRMKSALAQKDTFAFHGTFRHPTHTISAEGSRATKSNFRISPHDLRRGSRFDGRGLAARAAKRDKIEKLEMSEFCRSSD